MSPGIFESPTPFFYQWRQWAQVRLTSVAQHITLCLEAENLNLRTADLIVSQTVDCKSSDFSTSKGSASGKEKQKGMNPYTRPGLNCNWTDKHETDVMWIYSSEKSVSKLSCAARSLQLTHVPTRPAGKGVHKDHNKGWAGQVSTSKGSKCSRSSVFLPVDPSPPYALVQRDQETPPRAEPGWRTCESVWTHPPHPQPEPSLFSSHNLLSPLEDIQQRTHFTSPATLSSP